MSPEIINGQQSGRKFSNTAAKKNHMDMYCYTFTATIYLCYFSSLNNRKIFPP
jgi:hypothetical protein